MSLITCFECKQEVSELAETCPKCGAPVVSEIKAHAREVASYRYISGLAFFGGILWLVMAAYLEGPAGFAKDLKWVGWVIGGGAAYYIVGEIWRNVSEAKRVKRQA